MKKLFISIMAVAALVSCSKADITYDEATEISIAPVSGNITKVMMTGTSFETSQQFNVWAWYKQLAAGKTISEWQAATDVTLQEYIKESPFEFRSSTNWGGVTPYYWPKQGSLLFAGYYPTSIASSVDYTFDATDNKMDFSNITPDKVGTTADDYSEDIMYFNMTPSSVTSGPVAVEFKHALSWITVNVAKTEDSPKIVIDEIKFTDVYASGNGVVDGANPIEWTCITKDANNADVDPVEKVVATDVTLDEVTESDGKQVLTKLPVEPLFIPQNMLGNLYIKYTVYASETEKFTEEYNYVLSPSAPTTYNVWEPAKHYIYNIIIGTTEILIAPEIDDWDDVETGITIQ